MRSMPEGGVMAGLLIVSYGVGWVTGLARRWVTERRGVTAGNVPTNGGSDVQADA